MASRVVTDLASYIEVGGDAIVEILPCMKLKLPSWPSAEGLSASGSCIQLPPPQRDGIHHAHHRGIEEVRRVGDDAPRALSPADEKRLWRQVDLWLMPILSAMHLSFMDRGTSDGFSFTIPDCILDSLELSPNMFQSYTILPYPSVHLTLRPGQTTHIADLALAQCKAPADGIGSCISLRYCEGNRP